MKKIILTGGGTGGHVIPHLSLLDYLRQEYKIFYIGTNGIEKQIMSKQQDIKFYEIQAVKLDRSKFFKNFALPFKLIKAVKQCKKILKEIKPDVIFSKGGFVSVPVVIASHKLKIPIVSHESDLTMGLANKIIYHYCNCMCTSFKKTCLKKPKCVFTGSPIRKELFFGNKDKGYKLTNLNNDKPTILFMGGSTGALKLNKIIYTALPTLTKKYNIIHIVGKNKGDKTIYYPNYCQLEYVDNIQDIFAISDYIVSRAGSNAIYEFASLQKPMLLIPLPKDASRGDQIENAKLFEQLGYAHQIQQQDLNTITLLEQIEKLVKDKDKLVSTLKKENFVGASQKIFENIKKWTL